MKKIINQLILAAIALTASTLQSCGSTEEKTGLAADIEGVWESVYYHADESIYETKGTYGEWNQQVYEAENYPLTRESEDYIVLKFVNGTVSIIASNDADKEDATVLGVKFPYQLKGDRITSMIFQPETTEGYYAIEDMTEDSFNLVMVEKGVYKEDLEYDDEITQRVIHERDVTTFKRLK